MEKLQGNKINRIWDYLTKKIQVQVPIILLLKKCIESF
jgi:hypothetical protein